MMMDQLRSAPAGMKQNIGWTVLAAVALTAGCQTSGLYSRTDKKTKPHQTDAWQGLAQRREETRRWNERAATQSIARPANQGPVLALRSTSPSNLPAPIPTLAQRPSAEEQEIIPIVLDADEVASGSGVRLAYEQSPEDDNDIRPMMIRRVNHPGEAEPMMMSAPVAEHIVSGMSSGGCGTCCNSCCNYCPDLFGVGCDRCGLLDNISARIGGTYYSVFDDEVFGGLAILEGTKQLGCTPLFAHGGFAMQYFNGQTPAGFTVGGSKMAVIENGAVVRPLIVSATYDGYFDNEFFQTNGSLYLDQIRVLAGYAVSARTDLGVWFAQGLRSETTTAPIGLNQIRVLNARYGDRYAGYIASDVGARGAKLIASAGYEEDPGSFFTEIDAFIPVTNWLQLFAGFGYSNSSQLDAVAGIEILPGRLGRAGVADTGGTRFRGGWAAGDYRSALRVVTPTRTRRSLLIRESIQTLPAPVPVLLAPQLPVVQQPSTAGNGGLPNPSTSDEKPNTGSNNNNGQPIDQTKCNPTIGGGQPPRASRLSRFIEDFGKSAVPKVTN